MGVALRRRRDDRRILETVILPWFAESAACRRVLFVGCAWYTSTYSRFFAHAEYWTMDCEPAKARHGAARHIVDALQHVERHFDEASLDLVVCNGVWGWGLDGRAEAEAAFRGCFRCLADGGVLVLGWNDIASRRPFPLEQSAALSRFERWMFPPLGASRHRTANANRHTYDFYRK